MQGKNRLVEVTLVFLKLGLISFGGPAAHIAIMEEEIVGKRKWMDRQHFLDLIGATNLIPGPNSTEMTMHCGYERAGIPGLFAAGFAFLLPAVTITGILAWLYQSYGQLPEVAPFIVGIKPAVLAIIASAIFKLGKKAVKGWELSLLGLAVLAASLLGVNEILALLLAGVGGGLYFFLKNKPSGSIKAFFPFILLQASGTVLSQITTWKIFWTFLKVGAVLYGSGYVLFAYLDAELVTRGWLTRQQLLDAVAVGQFTPGPLLSTATFIGYQMDGIGGATAATLGIFLPSFLFVLLLNPLVPRMRQSRLLGFFLDSVNVAAVAVMAAVLWALMQETLTDWRALLIALLSVLMVFGLKRVSPVWAVVGGSLLGFLLTLI